MGGWWSATADFLFADMEKVQRSIVLRLALYTVVGIIIMVTTIVGSIIKGRDFGVMYASNFLLLFLFVLGFTAIARTDVSLMKVQLAAAYAGGTCASPELPHTQPNASLLMSMHRASTRACLGNDSQRLERA